MNNDKIIKMVQRKFPVMSVSIDLGNITDGKEWTIREIGGYTIKIEYGLSKVIIRDIQTINN